MGSCRAWSVYLTILLLELELSYKIITVFLLLLSCGLLSFKDPSISLDLILGTDTPHYGLGLHEGAD